MATCLALSLSAEAESFKLHLPAQSLATSLSQVAQQAKIQLLFDETLLKNVQAPALNGDYTPEVAIRSLLKNGELILKMLNDILNTRVQSKTQISIVLGIPKGVHIDETEMAALPENSPLRRASRIALNDLIPKPLKILMDEQKLWEFAALIAKFA